MQATATFEQARKTMDDSRVSDENFPGEERKKAQGEKLKAIHATNQENAKRRRTVSVAPPRGETHTAGGTPVLVLETMFEAAAEDGAAGGTGAASTHASDGDNKVKGKGKSKGRGKGKGKDSLELVDQGGVAPAADEIGHEEEAKKVDEEVNEEEAKKADEIVHEEEAKKVDEEVNEEEAKKAHDIVNEAEAK